MGLNYPGDWKFEGIGFPMPPSAVSAFWGLLTTAADRSKSLIETFKVNFGGGGDSTSYDWAVTDLERVMDNCKDNAAQFVDSVWKCIEAVSKAQLPAPSERVVNKILSENQVPLKVVPPNLILDEGDSLVVDDRTPSDAIDVSAAIPTLKLGELIGKGGYGQVYRATRLTSVHEFEFAVKILDPSPFVEDHEKALKRFQREVQALQGLQHRAIISYSDAGITRDKKPYVVMPLIRGENLTQACRSLPLEQRISIHVEILKALEYAHSAGVLHRDLKPSNIIVRKSDGQPIILDFGSAYMVDQLNSNTLTTQAVGTIGYIPSEVLADPRIRSQLHDVYACGIMLYETLAGHRPDPANYQSLQTVRDEYSLFDPIVVAAIAGAARRTRSAGLFAGQLVAALAEV